MNHDAKGGTFTIIVKAFYLLIETAWRHIVDHVRHVFSFEVDHFETLEMCI